MISKKILELLQKSKKGYHSLAELANYSGAEKSTLRVVLSRLTKQNRISRLFRGYYCFANKPPDLEQLSIELNYQSYISLEFALATYGILSQFPAQLTLVTPKRGASYTISNSIIEFSHIKKSLFFGYKINKHTQIATPEKALLDELYLIGLKKRTLNLVELDIKKINIKLFRKWLKNYPATTKRLANKLKL